MSVRNLWATLALASALMAGPLVASAGGMGDVAAHIRELNAICDKQRRGEIPRTPDYCLPELPPGYVYRTPPTR